MNKYGIYGAIGAIVVYMIGTVFSGWGFEPSKWTSIDRYGWFIFLNVYAFFGYIFGIFNEPK